MSFPELALWQAQEQSPSRKLKHIASTPIEQTAFLDPFEDAITF